MSESLNKGSLRTGDGLGFRAQGMAQTKAVSTIFFHMIYISEGALVCRACAGQLFGRVTFFLGWILPLGWVGGWVGGMGRFWMISPHGLAPFWLGI